MKVSSRMIFGSALFISAGLVSADYSTTEYTWKQGNTEISLGRDTDKICYLTGVSGAFDGPMEWVRVENRSANYYLKGGAGKSNASVQAWAHCVNNPKGDTYTSEFTHNVLKDGILRQSMEQADISNCFLTGMKGKFGGYMESIEINEYNRYSHLESKTAKYEVEAKGSCVFRTNADVGKEYTWKKGMQVLQMESADTNLCYLTKVNGDFGGYREWARIKKVGGYWTLSGATDKAFLEVRAKCVSSI